MGKWKPNARLARLAENRWPVAARLPAGNLNDRGEVRMSAIVVELMHLVLDERELPRDEKKMTALALIATAAWNASRLALRLDPPWQTLEKQRLDMHKAGDAVGGLYDILYARACELHPDDSRMILNTTVAVVEGELRVNAVSTRVSRRHD